jgi:hypothetical protein
LKEIDWKNIEHHITIDFEFQNATEEQKTEILKSAKERCKK